MFSLFRYPHLTTHGHTPNLVPLLRRIDLMGVGQKKRFSLLYARPVVMWWRKDSYIHATQRAVPAKMRDRALALRRNGQRALCAWAAPRRGRCREASGCKFLTNFLDPFVRRDTGYGDIGTGAVERPLLLAQPTHTARTRRTPRATAHTARTV